MTSLKTDFVFVFVSITVWVLIPVQNLTESGYLKIYTPIKNKRMLIENIFLLWESAAENKLTLLARQMKESANNLHN